ncbi:MAG TPA: permease [Acidimicrobiales bacterium]|nr:permease [Acidimicrobiales bacterium]
MITSTFFHGVGHGLREALVMLWITWWPLVLGFTLSGVVQSFLPRDGLRAQLGRTNATSVAKASLLGVISSSCSYAASAMSRALFARGASWTNSIVFMIASTNLVIELGIVLYLLLGWQFVAAQLVGGVLMIAALSFTTHYFFSRRHQEQLHERVLRDSPPPMSAANESWRDRVRDKESYSLAARFTIGDLTMLRKELLAGFLVAGFLMVDVPNRWWTHLFLSGHGAWTVVENVIIAPLLAVITFVCSVGNIPLAAALWAHGVAFGGVISFIFADLVTLPLLLIYRRFYGTRAALRLFGLLWMVMSAGGLVVDRLFHVASLLPASHHTRFASGSFALGWTLALNVVATALLVTIWFLARTGRHSTSTAADPICGMTVDITAPAATRRVDGVDYFFCSPRCAEHFDRRRDDSPTDVTGDAMG